MTNLIAILGAALICVGSLVAIVAPGDGQTAMFTYPLWFLGAIAGAVALDQAFTNPGAGTQRTFVTVLALISAGSVVQSICAGQAYTRDQKRKDAPPPE